MRVGRGVIIENSGLSCYRSFWGSSHVFTSTIKREVKVFCEVLAKKHEVFNNCETCIFLKMIINRPKVCFEDLSNKNNYY